MSSCFPHIANPSIGLSRSKDPRLTKETGVFELSIALAHPNVDR